MLSHYYSAAVKSHQMALYELGSYYQNTSGYESDKIGIDFFKKSGENGCAADTLKAISVIEGQNTTEVAIVCLEQQARKGRAEFQFILGSLYEEGIKNYKNLDKAVFYYTLAAGQGHPEAQYKLGCIYFNRKNGKYNIELAIKYLKLACAHGNTSTGYELGCIYLDGEGIPPDTEIAINFLKFLKIITKLEILWKFIHKNNTNLAVNFC